MLKQHSVNNLGDEIAAYNAKYQQMQESLAALKEGDEIHYRRTQEKIKNNGIDEDNETVSFLPPEYELMVKQAIQQQKWHLDRNFIRSLRLGTKERGFKDIQDYIAKKKEYQKKYSRTSSIENIGERRKSKFAVMQVMTRIAIVPIITISLLGLFFFLINGGIRKVFVGSDVPSYTKSDPNAWRNPTTKAGEPRSVRTDNPNPIQGITQQFMPTPEPSPTMSILPTIQPIEIAIDIPEPTRPLQTSVNSSISIIDWIMKNISLVFFLLGVSFWYLYIRRKNNQPQSP